MSVHSKPKQYGPKYHPKPAAHPNRKPPAILRVPLLLAAALAITGRDDMAQRLQWAAAKASE